MIEVIPAILTSNPQELKQLINQAEEVVERIQIDVLDGQFAGNKTIEPSIFETIETNLKLDFQLMTKEPVSWVERCVRVEADRIIGHIEMMASQVEFVEKVIGTSALVGLALDLDTPISELDPEVLASLDVVLVMAVPAGFGGQEFNEEVINKIELLDKTRKKEKVNFKICVDGGVTEKVIGQLAKAGADEVCIGRRLFKGDLRENINRFKNLGNK